jgi:hypothetical protein
MPKDMNISTKYNEETNRTSCLYNMNFNSFIILLFYVAIKYLYVIHQVLYFLRESQVGVDHFF